MAEVSLHKSNVKKMIDEWDLNKYNNVILYVGVEGMTVVIFQGKSKENQWIPTKVVAAPVFRLK